MSPIDRRTALKWVVAAGAATQLQDLAFAANPVQSPGAIGYGKDPDLLRSYRAGELWPLTLNESQRRTTRALCDLIIPADGPAPAASAVATDAFIDEWISAPYPNCQRDREQLLRGLAWLDEESRRRDGHAFADGSAAQMSGICDDICNASKAAAQFGEAAAFFARFRELTALGYYTTPVGMRDLGYVGNVPLPAFDGPPPEVLKRLGLD